MERRPRKPLRQWELTPYISVLLYLSLGSAVIPLTRGPWQTVSFVVVCAGAVAIVVWMLVAGRGGQGNPNRDGALTSLDGIRLAEAHPTDGYRTRVHDTHRYQASLDRVARFGSGETRAVLVPDATRWLGRLLRVGVEIVDVDGRASRAGFLSPEHNARWRELLTPLRESGLYVAVPARVTGKERQRTLELDLGDVERVVAETESVFAPGAGGVSR
ncbi:hypothetical protein GCM10027416_24880 [Okibacterium endophyticum]